MSKITEFWDFIDNRSMVRRSVLFVTVYMSWLSFQWAMVFATETAKSGAEVGLIIAAVTGPVAALQGFILKVYSDARSV
jgi:hypothetical protein